MLTLRTALAIVTIFAVAARSLAAPPALIEVKVGDDDYEGKVVAHGSDVFWLMGRDGRMTVLETKKVDQFRQVSPQFRGWSPAMLQNQMRRELGKPFDVAATRHYVVCAVGDQKARQYAETFEELFRTFQMYFSVRNFKVAEPEFPMVAIVFPDPESFARYANKDRVPVGRGLKGYYLSTSNRVALFESGSDRLSDGRSRLPLPQATGLLAGAASRVGPVPVPSFVFASLEPGSSLHWEAAPNWPSIEASLKDTMIHEATHQAAFNTGLHSRLGANPKWVVEGLATVFEAAGIRQSGANTGVKSRINPERLVWFGDFVKSRRKPQSLESFVAGDELFQQNALDAYSQAWALTFFLIETRPRNYADYLRGIAARDPLRGYPAEARVADFKRSISGDFKLLDAEFLRFIAGIR